jgi:hypothetical protein
MGEAVDCRLHQCGAVGRRRPLDKDGPGQRRSSERQHAATIAVHGNPFVGDSIRQRGNG